MAGRIEKRGDNSYRLIAYGGYGPDGKQIVHKKTVKARSTKEADKLLAEFVTEVDKGLIVTQKKLKLSEFADLWLAYSEKQHEPKTVHRNREILNTRILPALGHLRLDKIQPTHLMQFYNNLSEPGLRMDKRKGTLSPRTIQMHHKLLSSMLTKAVQWQLMLSNPCQRVEPPKVPSSHIPIYDEKQTKHFLKLLDTEDPKYRLLVLLALTTGLRRGELFGLEWSHIDFTNKTILVCQSSQYLPGSGLITKSPKTKTSERLISVPETVMELLEQFQEHQLEQEKLLDNKWKNSRRIFVTWDGAPMHPDSFNTWLDRFIEKNKLPHITPHSFRHMAATFALVQGISLKSVSSRLGHSKTSTTADIYAHALKSVDKEIASKMDDFISSVLPQNNPSEQTKTLMILDQ